MPPGQSRYLSISIMNVEQGDVYLPIIEQAAAAGINSFLLNVNWDHIYPRRGAAPDWSQVDKQVALIERLRCKVMLRIWVARHDDATWWPNETRPLSGDGLRNELLGSFSYNDPSAVAEANAFIREVAERFHAKQQAGLIALVAVATTKTSEIGYHFEGFNPATNQDILQAFDYSPSARRGFQEWAERKYGNLASLNRAWFSDFSKFSEISPPAVPKDPWGSFNGEIGKDWYLFRHASLKKLMDGFVSTVKGVDPNYKFVHDMGSCYDAISNLRGTLGFKDLCANSDGLKLNDDHSYPHRFATDLLRSNLSGKIIGHELGNAGGGTVGDWRQYINEAYEHGVDWVNMFGFDRPFSFPLGESLIKETAAKWLTSPVPDIQPSQTVTYTLSEAIRMGTGRVQTQWRNEYNKSYTPIKVLLIEDLLSENPSENRPPIVASPLSDQRVQVGKDFQYSIPEATFSDPDGYITAVTATGLPDGISMSGRTISGKASLIGDYIVTITARDNQGAQVAAQFKLTVSEGGVDNNQPPVVARAIPDQSGTVGATFAYEVARETFTDPDGTVTGVSFAGLPAGVSASGWRLSGTPTAAGVSTVTVTATDNAGASVSTQFRVAIAAAGGGNQPPLVSRTIPNQTATVGTAFSYMIPTNTFTDAETPNQLTLSVSGLPAGLMFTAPATISGTPTTSGMVSVTVTATDPGALSASTMFTITVNPASVDPGTFAITGITTLSCSPVPGSSNQRSLTFTPKYSGVNGQPITFSVANEKIPTTAPGPYTLSVYVDNPILTLKASQQGTSGEVNFAYNWLALCGTNPTNTAPTVANTIPDQSGTVGAVFAYEVARETFTDPDGTITAVSFAGLPAGVSASGWRLSGTPTAAGISTVTVTATDNAGASVSTQFRVAIAAAGGGNQPPVVARAIPDQPGTVGVAFAYEVARETFTDPDGTVTAVSFAGLPAGVSASGWRLSGAPTAAGVSTVTVTATDNAGASVSTQFRVAIAAAGGGNQPPVVARAIPDQSGTVGAAFAYEMARETFTDPDGTITAVSFAGLPAGVSASGWRLSGTPTAAGVSTVTVTATDNAGASVSTQFRLSVQAVPTDNTISLFAAGNFLTRRFIRDILEGDTLKGEEIKQTVNILVFPKSGTVGSYSFVLAGPVSITSEDSSTPYGVFGDNGGSVLTPGNYTLTVKSYPNAALQGAVISQQILHFVVSDGAGQKNRLPVLTKAPGTLYAKVGKPYAYRLPDSTFVDPDGYLTNFTLTALPDGLKGEGTLITGTPTKKGEFTVNAQVTDNGGGVAETTFRFIVSTDNMPPIVKGSVPDQIAEVNKPFTFTLPNNIFEDTDGTIVSITFIGPPEGTIGQGYTIKGVPTTVREYPIIVIAADDANATAQVTFKIKVVASNRPPVVAKSIGDQVAEGNSDYRFIIPAGTFTDPDGRIVRLEISGLPEGITARGDTLSGRATQMGEFVVSVKAFDDLGASAALTFKLSVQGNQPPRVARAISDQTADSNTEYRFVLPEGTFISTSGRIARTEFSGLPSGLTALGDTISGRPTIPGEYPVSVRAYDDKGASVQTSFKFTVKGAKADPTVTPIADVIAIVGQVFTFDVKSYFKDEEGTLASITYASALPPGITANGSQLAGNPTAVGTYPIKVIAKDKNGGSIEASFRLKVERPELRVSLYAMGQGTKKMIREVANVDRMSLDTLPPALNLFVESNAVLTSVSFQILGSVTQKNKDEAAPFGLFGDTGSFPAAVGSYTISIIGYRNSTQVASRLIWFTIIKAANSPGRLGTLESEAFSETELWKPYPTPFVDRVKVQTAPQGYTKLHTVEVLSSEGKILPLPTSNWTVEESLLEVDLSGTATLPGVYLLRITEENGKQKTLRILKAPQK